ncbi:MAG: hypothetical protein QOE90_2255 [Thermoplasmata archaeon]|jgi:hypothetical protein|nr:hypothetical protein [Thermoplasmata archaeon]
MQLPDAPLAADQMERDRLEYLHDEMRTALTALQTNVDLAVRELGHDAAVRRRVEVIAHLTEVDGAVARLRALARLMQRWRGSGL